MTNEEKVKALKIINEIGSVITLLYEAAHSDFEIMLLADAQVKLAELTVFITTGKLMEGIKNED